jgi:hypothetical protein
MNYTMLKLVASAFYSPGCTQKIPSISKVIATFTPFEKKKYIAFMFKYVLLFTATIILMLHFF